MLQHQGDASFPPGGRQICPMEIENESRLSQQDEGDEVKIRLDRLDVAGSVTHQTSSGTAMRNPTQSARTWGWKPKRWELALPVTTISKKKT